MFGGLPSAGECLALLTVLAAVFITILLVALKLCGVLLMGWLSICMIIPLTITGVIILAIIRNI